MQHLSSFLRLCVSIPLLCGGAALAQTEIHLLPESRDYASSEYPLEDEIYEGYFDANADAPLVIGKPLDLKNLRGNLPFNDDGFPDALYAGYIARITKSASLSATYRVSAVLTAPVGEDGANGIQFRLDRDSNFYALECEFRGAAAFPLSERHPIEKLLSSSNQTSGFGSVTSLIVGDSESGEWWISTYADARKGSPMSDLKNSVWRVLDPETLEAGSEAKPVSFNLAGLLMQQTPKLDETVNRPRPANPILTRFSVTLDE